MRVSELKLRKIGNSRGVIIPSEILMLMNASDDTVLTISVNDSGVVTLEKKASRDPFAKFARFAEAWDGIGDVEAEHVDKNIEIW